MVSVAGMLDGLVMLCTGTVTELVNCCFADLEDDVARGRAAQASGGAVDFADSIHVPRYIRPVSVSNWPSYLAENDDGAWYEPLDADFDRGLSAVASRQMFQDRAEALLGSAEGIGFHRCPERLWARLAQEMATPLGPNFLGVLPPGACGEMEWLRLRLIREGGFSRRATVDPVTAGGPRSYEYFEFRQGRWVLSLPSQSQRMLNQLNLEERVTATTSTQTVLQEQHMQALFRPEDEVSPMEIVGPGRTRARSSRGVVFGSRVHPTTANSTVRALNLFTHGASGAVRVRMMAAQESVNWMRFSHQLCLFGRGVDDHDLVFPTSSSLQVAGGGCFQRAGSSRPEL